MLVDLIMSFIKAAFIVAVVSSIIYIFIKYPKVFIVTVFVTIIIVMMIVCPTVAEQAEQVKVCWIVPFTYKNFAIGIFTVMDEEGNLWDFYLGEGSYVVGDEYILHLPVDEDPWLEKEVSFDELCIS